MAHSTVLRPNRIALALALLAGVLTGWAWMGSGWLGGQDTVHIRSSWGFDLADERSVFGYAPFIMIAQVEKRLGVSNESTLFSVLPISQVKGAVPDRVTIAQTGFEQDGVVYELEEQPLLRPGGTYLLALTAPSNNSDLVLTLVGGTVSGREVDPSDAELMTKLERWASQAVWPDALLDSAAPLQTRRSAEWTAQHAREGFAMAP